LNEIVEILDFSKCRGDAEADGIDRI